MSAVEKLSRLLPISQELLRDNLLPEVNDLMDYEVRRMLGLIPSDPEWEAKRAKRRENMLERRARVETKVAALLDQFDKIEEPLARKFLDFHRPMPMRPGRPWPGCYGCEFGENSPDWPCFSVELVAEHHGIAIPNLLS